MLMYIRNIAEKVIKYIRSHVVNIFIHEESNVVAVDMFHNQNVFFYIELVYIYSEWDTTYYAHSFVL